MEKEKNEIVIKGERIPLRIRNYRNSKKIRIFFHESLLCISKPLGYSNKRLEKLIQENEELIWKQYQEAKEKEKYCHNQWMTGEKLLLYGTLYEVIREIDKRAKKLEIVVKKEEKKICIVLPKEEVDKNKIDRKVIELFRDQTKKIVDKKLDYWSKQTKLSYDSVRVSDTKSKYGSCIPQRKALQFSARLCMLTEEEIDAVIVHELCHLKYQNHSKEFYGLVQQYIPNYSEINRLLKKSGKKIIF